MDYSIEALAEDGNLCGEAPTWLRNESCLVWTDLGSSLVYKLNIASGVKSVISRELMVAGIALNFDGRFVFAGERGLHLWKGPGNYRTILFEHRGEELFFNDILADPAGLLYAGTRYWGPNGVVKPGKLYLVDTDGSVRVVDEGFELANGLGLNPQGTVLYVTDTPVRTIYAYDVDPDTGLLSDKRVFIKIPDDEGLPDGLTVDSEGYIWSAQYFGGQVVRYDPEGKVHTRVPLPVTRITSMCFGGKDLTDLYVTSAAERGPVQYLPTVFDHKALRGGSLYRVHTEVLGKRDLKTRFDLC